MGTWGSLCFWLHLKFQLIKTGEKKVDRIEWIPQMLQLLTKSHQQQQTSAHSQQNGRQNINSCFMRKGPQGGLTEKCSPLFHWGDLGRGSGYRRQSHQGQQAVSWTWWEKYNATKKQANIIEQGIPGGNTFMVHNIGKDTPPHQQLGKSEDHNEFLLTPTRLLK